MRKYTNDEEVVMVATEGEILSISALKTNENDNQYYSFTAKLETTRVGREITAQGTIYLKMIENLGEIPKVGERFKFVTDFDSLANNTAFWGITGRAIDNVDEDLLKDLLEFEID